MTNKEKYIKAMEETIAKHKDPVGKAFITISDCTLCKLTGKKSFHDNCKPCPYSSNYGTDCCNVIYDIYYKEITCDYFKLSAENEEGYKELQNAAEVLEEHLEIMKKAPPERFTKKGFKEWDWTS